MASNFKSPGNVLTVAAPYDRTSGQGALIGSIFGIALSTVVSGATGDFRVTGIWTLAKTSAQAWTLGAKIYWDDTNKRCDTDSTVGQLIGVATEVADNPSSTGVVRLNADAPATAEGPQATIAALTDNSGGATADGTIGAIGTFTPSVSWNGSSVYPSAADATSINTRIVALTDAVKELSAKQNAILAALKAAGIIASS